MPIKGVRKMTAQAMVASAFTAPHVTEWVTVDVTATMELVERLKKDQEFRDVKVTPLLVLAKALCLAMRRTPESTRSGTRPRRRSCSSTTSTSASPRPPRAGWSCPTSRTPTRMSLLELAEALGALTATAREGRTQPAEMAGGTITITNVGVFGVDAGTPIINPGESAILAFGAIASSPWVVTGADGARAIVPRGHHAGARFDHRLVDGEMGCRFLADVAAILEDPARALVWG